MKVTSEQNSGKMKHARVLPCCLVVTCWIGSIFLFACLWMAVAKLKEGEGVESHFGNSSLSINRLMNSSNDTFPEKLPIYCVQGFVDLMSSLMFSIQTQTATPSQTRSIDSHCSGALFVAILHNLVYIMFQGFLFSILFWKMPSRKAANLFQFEPEILIEEVKQSASKKLIVLHFKVQKLSEEITSNLTISARLVWVNAENKTSPNNIDEDDGYLESIQLVTELESKIENHQLELSYDKTGKLQTQFHIFPWPTKLFHHVKCDSPLWHNRKSLTKRMAPEFKIELTVKGFKSNLTDSFAETYTYKNEDVSYLNEFVSHAIFGRKIDSDGNYCVNN